MTLADLEARFDEALAAALPAPAALIFTDLPLAYQGKRDLLYALGLLNEGENEAALIAGLLFERLRAAPQAGVEHLMREAWYYLRTSIDPSWQFDDGAPSLPALLAYLDRVLDERAATARALPRRDEPDGVPPAERAALLRRLRARAEGLRPA
jgi:hypothetical protein